jgi:hypothetical protein
VDWIGLAKDRNRWRTLVNSVLSLRVPWNAGKLSSGLTSSGLSSSAQLRRVSSASYPCVGLSWYLVSDWTPTAVFQIPSTINDSMVAVWTRVAAGAVAPALKRCVAMCLLLRHKVRKYTKRQTSIEISVCRR